MVPENDQPVAENAAPWQDRTVQLTLLLTGCLTGFTCLLPVIPGLIVLRAEWAIWLSLAHIAALAVILRVFRFPKSRRGWCVFLVANLFVGSVAWLWHRRLFAEAMHVGMDLILRFAFLATVMLIVAGLPFVLTWLVRRARRITRAPSLLAKTWFATALALGLIEPIMLSVERQQDRLAFPRGLPRTDPDTFHIVGIGGSSMMGHPYDYKFDLPSVMAWRLRQIFPDRTFTVENLSEPGRNLREAIVQLQQLKSRPDLLLVYSGHNELFRDLDEIALTTERAYHRLDQWFNWSATFRVLSGRLAERMAIKDLEEPGLLKLVSTPYVTPNVRERRKIRFRRYLEQLADYRTSESISTLWFIPAASESDWEPNRSTAGPAGIVADRKALPAIYETARRLQRDGKPELAATEWRKGLERSPDFAEFHFRLAECLFELGDDTGARRHFVLAMDADGHPIRANSDYRNLIREVAVQRNILLVDSPAVLRRHTEHGILDRSLFYDNAHPTLRTLFLLSVAAVETLVEHAIPGRPAIAEADIPEARFANAVSDLSIGRDDVSLAYRRIAHGVAWLRRWRFEKERRDRDAKRYEELAEKLASREIDPGQMGTDSLED